MVTQRQVNQAILTLQSVGLEYIRDEENGFTQIADTDFIQALIKIQDIIARKSKKYVLLK